MKKTRILTIAALLAFALAGCMKDKAGSGIDPLSSGADTKLSISLNMAPATRGVGDPVAGTASESKVNFVNVYIFNSAGKAVMVGANTRIPIADFNRVGTTDVYQLKSDKLIATVAGDNIVYVGINIPTTIANGPFDNVDELLAAIANVENLYVADDFYMFSDATESEMVEFPTTSSMVNEVSVKVDRIAAKLAVTAATASVANTWNAPGADYDGMVLDYGLKTFSPFNKAKTSYVAPNYWAGGTLAGTLKTTGELYTFDESVVAPVYQKANVTIAPASPAAITQVVYVGENMPAEQKRGLTTYLMVATTVKINMAADWYDGGVIYESVADYGNGTSDVWVVEKLTAPQRGYKFITNSSDKATAIYNGFGGTAADAEIVKFTAGWVHFPVYIDGVNADHVFNVYGIARNQFLRANVTKVAGGPGQFPGIPGDPDDPTKPGGGDPEDPDKPVDGTEVDLFVEIEVNPWDYLSKDVVLE